MRESETRKRDFSRSVYSHFVACAHGVGSIDRGKNETVIAMLQFGYDFVEYNVQMIGKLLLLEFDSTFIHIEYKLSPCMDLQLSYKNGNCFRK